MTAISANPPRRQVVVVIYDDVSLLDLAGPLQVFAWARHGGTSALAYDVSIASYAGGTVSTDTILSAKTEPMQNWSDRKIDTLLIAGGDGVYAAIQDLDFLSDLQNLIGRSSRVCSVCSGAIALAATGILDGRRAVTHWEDADALTRLFPHVKLERDPIYLRDGNIWTSAGVTSGIDMALALVAEDLGQEAAMERAQALVTYMVRPGGQSQFSPALVRQKTDRSGRFDALHAWIRLNLNTDLSNERLAEQSGMSLRSFHRLYAKTTGQTPAKSVEAIRIERARDLLETTGHSLKVVANRCGFNNVDRMRRSFLRELGILPQDYRKRFQLH